VRFLQNITQTGFPRAYFISSIDIRESHRSDVKQTVDWLFAKGVGLSSGFEAGACGWDRRYSRRVYSPYLQAPPQNRGRGWGAGRPGLRRASTSPDPTAENIISVSPFPEGDGALRWMGGLYRRAFEKRGLGPQVDRVPRCGRRAGSSAGFRNSSPPPSILEDVVCPRKAHFAIKATP